VRELFLKKLNSERYVMGSTSGRLLDGNTVAHVELEARLSALYAYDEALLYNSGYDANLSVFSGLPVAGDVFVFDQFAHASMRDGMRLSACAAAQFPFAHNSPEALRAVLHKVLDERPEILAGHSKVFIAVDALYSMDGDFAPLAEIVDVLDELLPRTARVLVVDEAHSVGCFGRQGRGIVDLLGLEDKVDIIVHTYSKALGTTSAVVLCSSAIYAHLWQYSRPLIFSTSLNRATLTAIITALDVLESPRGDLLLRQLGQVAAYASATISAMIARVGPAKIAPLAPHRVLRGGHFSPIVAIVTPYAMALAAFLLDRGYYPKPIVFPAVPRGKERIRICVHAFNTVEQVDALIALIELWASTYDGARDVFPSKTLLPAVASAAAEAGDCMAETRAVPPQSAMEALVLA
jgi:8-amino-7-oxononanoate synthase